MLYRSFDAVGATCHWFIIRLWPWPWPGSGVHLPLLGWWHVSELLPQVCVLSLQHPWPWPTFDLQHEVKWFLLPHLWHFLPNAGHSLYACVSCYIYYTGLSVLPLYELLAPFELPFLLPFLLHLKLSITFIIVGSVIHPFELWWLKSFTVISCSLAYWSRDVYITSSCLFLTRPTSWSWSAWSHEIITQSYIPVFQPPCTDISWLDSLYIDLAYLLTHCLLAWYCCRFHQCGSSMKLTPLVSLQWPEKLLQGPFGPLCLLRWVTYSISWNIPYRDSLQLLQPYFLLDAGCS